MIENLYKLEKAIFHEFALETSNNIHVRAVDLNNPLSSVCKIFLSDIISTQLHSRPSDLPIIIPTRIFIEDLEGKKYCYIKIEPPGIAFIEDLFKERDLLEDLIDKATPENKPALEIQKGQIIDRFRNAVLRDHDQFYAKCVSWAKADKAIADCPDYCQISRDLNDVKPIVFDNSGLQADRELKPHEKVNYIIKVSHQRSHTNALTEENVDEFLAKLSVLALHTKRNRKTFAEIETLATKAAISQVMARNMSHNIGSHVMNRLTNGIKLEAIKTVEGGSYGPAFALSKEEGGIFHQLAFYNHYVKCRMDYLSDITFGTPVMHTNKKVVGELFKELDKVRFLLDYVPGLSTFKYKIEILFAGRQMIDSGDIAVAIPNDLLGCQAFYNILENVIRNTAKHNAQKRGTTVFTIDINNVSCSLPPALAHEGRLSDEIRTLYSVEIYDDCVLEGDKEFSGPQEQAQLTEYVSDYNSCNPNVIDLNARVSNVDWLVYRQNEKINQSVLQENNQLRTSSLGLIEMQASAAYLRKLDSAAIEDKGYIVDYNDKFYNSKGNINILKAFSKDGRLGYRFFLGKPTEILIVGNFEPNIRADEWLKAGVWVREEASFKTELENGYVYNHPFVLYERSESIAALLEAYKTCLPMRQIDISDKKESLEKILKSTQSVEGLEEWVWALRWDQIKGTIENVNVITSYHASYHSQPNTYNVGFVSHAAGWKSRETERKTNLVQYLEPLSSNAAAKLPNHSGTVELHTYLDPGKPYLTTVAKMKIFESATTKILVLDERIQRFSDDNYQAYGAAIPNKNIFAYSNVVIPDRMVLQLDADNFTPELIEGIENFILGNLAECDFLLVHYSILERMYGEISVINENLSLWSESIRVVVTSGRGKPAELPSAQVCFVNLSPALNVFVEVRSKFAMNYLLQSARR